MERRSEIRRGARVTAYLYGTGRRPVRCETGDLSAGGVFLHAPGLRAQPGDIMPLVFTLEFDRVVRTYRRWARVAHCREDGIGVQLYRQRPEEACSASRA